MKKILIILFLTLIPLFLFAQTEELKAKLAANPADIESLEALLKIYEENYDYNSYINTVIEVAHALTEIPEGMVAIFERTIEKALDNYYSEQAGELSKIYFDNFKNRKSLLYYLRSLNSSWYLSESDVRYAVTSIENEDHLELYKYLYEESKELYPTDLSLIVSKILVEDFGESEFLIPYIENLFYDGDFTTAEELLMEYSQDLAEEPMYYFLKGLLALNYGNYDEAVELFLQGKSFNDEAALGNATQILDYIYIPDYVSELFRAIVLSSDEASLQNNLQSYMIRHEELDWIYSWLSRVPAPKKIDELLEGEEVVISYNTLNMDYETGSVGFFDIEGNLFGSLADAIYGQFLDSKTFVYISLQNERVVVEGERKARFNGYTVYSLSPDRSKFLLLDNYGEKIVMIGPELTQIWSADGDFGMIPVSWSPDGYRVAVSTDYDVFSIFNADTGEVLETVEGWYDLVFLSNDNAYAIDYDGNIVDLSTDEPLKTAKTAVWAEFGSDNRIIYFIPPEEYGDFSYIALRVYDLETGTDRVLGNRVLWMDAPVPSIKVEGPYIYFTEKDTNGMHRVLVMDYTTNELLFESMPSYDVLIFPDVRPE
ncbi:MAG TPA: hypothetical protein PK411_07265 [Mesotoga infera]|nr:hypothetical protein [Mesotoga sp.]HON28165.1 hypothetical protein [Mesotoga infera]HPD38132.1 hypothetical protein [Mesotoga infera]HRR44266.1 hypothetical protein [Mesotoga sp.]